MSNEKQFEIIFNLLFNEKQFKMIFNLLFLFFIFLTFKIN